MQKEKRFEQQDKVEKKKKQHVQEVYDRAEWATCLLYMKQSSLKTNNFLFVFMESESNLTGDLPPALPLKHCRNLNRWSVGSSAPLSPGLQAPCTLNDVFDSTNCHAASCPIHKDFDSEKHQMRFMSDSTPPPVPKKRLVRTLSLPTVPVPRLCPVPPGRSPRMHPHNFDNPVYMLTPVREPASSAPLLPLSQLSFDTPDEHLSHFFVNFKDRNAVSQSVEHRHLIFLRTMAHKMEEDMRLKEELSEKPVSTYQPQDFLLDEDSEPKAIAGRIYYSVHSHMFPGRTLGLRICKQMDTSVSTCTNLQPAHLNVNHILACFRSTSSMMDTCNKTSATSPHRGSIECGSVYTVQHLLWKGHSVVIERDLPLATLENFVQENQALHNMDCVLYDRRVCFLLLQILQGAQHLYNNNTSVPGLMPQDIVLVWPDIKKGNRSSKRNNTVIKMGHESFMQTCWKTRGCPRVVISTHSFGLPVSQSAVSFNANICALIQYCLKVHTGIAALYMSTYRKALLSLGSQLNDNSSSLHIHHMVNVLQMALWGPGALSIKHIDMSTVQSWLVLKRALLVMKMAEKCVDQTDVDWEDILCLKFVAFTEAETVLNETSLAE